MLHVPYTGRYPILYLRWVILTVWNLWNCWKTCRLPAPFRSYTKPSTYWHYPNDALKIGWIEQCWITMLHLIVISIFLFIERAHQLRRNHNLNPRRPVAFLMRNSPLNSQTIWFAIKETSLSIDAGQNYMICEARRDLPPPERSFKILIKCIY